MKSFALAVCLSLAVFLAVPAPAAGQATGHVYHDRNGNGERDEGEPGVPGVLVSNGVDVVEADSTGSYRLPVSDDAILFVIKPRGWRTPLGEDNLNRFYYTHKPEGSPELDYAGVEPTGPLPASVDFPLYPQPAPERFTVLVFGDPQPYSLTQVDYLAQDVVEELVGVEGVAFGITMGDIVGDDLSLFEPLNDAIAQVGIPWYYVYGNHDMNYDAPSDTLADETFERVYGPPTYAFTYGRVHFIVLDDVIYPSGIEGRAYVGGLRDDQLAFVENYLAHVPESDLVVLNMHIPFEKEGATFRTEDRDRLFALLAEHPNTLSLSAHTHMQRHLFFDRASGWTQDAAHHHYNVGTTSGSWWNGMKDETGIPHTMMRDGTPNGYAFITFEGNDYVIDYKAAGYPPTYRMNIWSSDPVEQGTGADSLVVNVFSGSSKTEVAYWVEGAGKWTRMTKVEGFDPHYLALHQRWETFEAMGLVEEWERRAEAGAFEVPGTPLPDPDRSTHLWQAPLPADLPAGRHRVEVRVMDMFGRTFTGVHTFRVVAP